MGYEVGRLVHRVEADAVGPHAEELGRDGHRWLDRLAVAVHDGKAISPVERDRFARWRKEVTVLNSSYRRAAATGALDAPVERVSGPEGWPVLRSGTNQWRLDPRAAGEIDEAKLNHFLIRLHSKLEEPFAEAQTIGVLVGVARMAGETPQGLSDGTGEVAATVARAGYLTRVVETELLTGAASPDPVVADAFGDRLQGAGWSEQVMEQAFAWSIGDGDLRWRVAGLGGDLRDFYAELLSFSTLEMCGYRPPNIPPRWPLDALRRAFMYGFFLRCCEEALPPGRLLGADLE